METILRDQILKHLEDYETIRCGRLCLTNLLCLYRKRHNNLDYNKPVDIIYLGLENTFDKVLHKFLIAKLKSHGINGVICNWVEDGQRNRKELPL